MIYGRPKKPKAELRAKYVRVRVTNAEREKILRRWKASNVKTESDWIRGLLLADE